MHIPPYGFEDTSYQHAGGEEGLTALCRRFYDAMDTEEPAAHIRAMHGEDLEPMVDRLCAFLCGWLGGPRLYNERYGNIAIPRFHQKFPIGPKERDAWLHCMQIAVDEQPWRDDFKLYIMQQLAVPAERCRTH